MNKILLYNSGGGLGDCIQLFDLITSLKIKFKNSEIYYLGAHENHFQKSLKEYNIDIPTFNIDLKYFGFRWKHLLLTKNKLKKISVSKFDLVIDLQSKIRNTLILKQIPSKHFYSPTMDYFFSSDKNKYLNTKNNINLILDNVGKLINEEIKKIKYDIFYRYS